MKITTIPCIQAKDMPKKVEDYCIEQEISTHYQSTIIGLNNDNNPLSNWLRENGYIFKSEYDYIGIIAT